jgi:hypothetical protein
MGRWFWQWVETRTIGRAVLSCIDPIQTKRAAPTGPPFFYLVLRRLRSLRERRHGTDGQGCRCRLALRYTNARRMSTDR